MPVELKSGLTSVEVVAKIDTGADFCVFQQTVAEQLGLDIEHGERMWIWTVNGRFQAFGHEVEIDVLGIVISSVVYFYADANFGRNVLGRRADGSTAAAPASSITTSELLPRPLQRLTC